jgi:hypothetical protein
MRIECGAQAHRLRTTMKTHLPRFLVFLLLAACFVSAAEPEPLEKADAAMILQAMDWERVQVVAIVNGVHQKGVGSLACATVIGLGRRDGGDREIVQSFFYDRDLGWFFFETAQGKMRIWNRDGYREVKP